MIAPARRDSGSTAERSHTSVDGRPFYFGSYDRRMFGHYHAATGDTLADCAVILVGSIGGETTGTPRSFRHWAEHLASSGVSVLRYDHHGTGDSDGRENDPDRLRSWIDGVGEAIDAVRAKSGVRAVVLVGVHLGATIALGAALERGDVAGLLLWAAAPTGNAFLREGRAFTRLLAANAFAPLENGSEQIGGFEFSQETIASLKAFDPAAGGGDLSIPVLVVPRDESTNDAPFLERLTALGAQVERRAIAGYAAMMEDAHKAVVPADVIAASTDWLTRTFRQRGTSAILTPDGSDYDQTLELAVTPTDAGSEPSMRLSEKPIRFGENDQLFGILTCPSRDARRRTGVLLVNAGAVSHVGPNRLYVSLARRWASLGYMALRMDLAGLGESHTPAGAEENHSYPSHATANIATALSVLRQNGAERVIVAGLCSGAHASFHAGLQLDGLDGLLMINPIVFYWKPSDPLDPGAWMNYVESRHYKQAALQWRSWVRLFQAKVDVRNLARVGVTRATEVARAKRASLFRRFFGTGNSAENAADDLRSIVDRGTHLLLFFSEGEPGKDFLTLNYARELNELRRLSAFDLHVIKDADHTFTAPAARLRAEIELTEHLLAHHP